MTLHDVKMMHSYWRRNPPLRVLVAVVARVLGVEFPDADAKPNKYMTADDLALMMRVTGGKIPGIGQAHG